MENSENVMAQAIKNGACSGAEHLTSLVVELANSGEFLKAAKTAEVLAEYLRSTHRELDVM